MVNVSALILGYNIHSDALLYVRIVTLNFLINSHFIDCNPLLKIMVFYKHIKLSNMLGKRSKKNCNHFILNADHLYQLQMRSC